MKSRNLSIFLLKPGYNAENALKGNHSLVHCSASNIPQNASLFLADGQPTPPWWKSYLGIVDEDNSLLQSFKGALLFLPVNDRTFAITFGNVYHNLREESYVYDFGLLTTLNSVSPQALKSTDVLRPETALRQRIQTPKNSELDTFDFDKESSIIKKITGKVRGDYNALFTNAAGASSLRLTTKKSSLELESLCADLLAIYQKEDYKAIFSDLQNIRTIKDPCELMVLDAALTEELRKESQALLLTIPDIIDYDLVSGFRFSDKKKDTLYEDIDISTLYTEIGDSISSLSIDQIKSQYTVTLFDENNQPRFRYPLYQCLIWDYTNSRGETFHLCDGDWYQVDSNFLSTLNNTVDSVIGSYPLPDYTHESEAEYNSDVPQKDKTFICLDQTNIALNGDQIEPCDLFRAEEETSHFVHVKIEKGSQSYSHLFNQGISSLAIINSQEGSREKLKDLIQSRISKKYANAYMKAVDSRRSTVIYAIITPKDKSLKSKAIPLFSRISLKHAIATLNSMNAKCIVTFVNNISI